MGKVGQGVNAWLMLVCLVIVAMIAVGGATRLTQSGLSMVDWKPISGIVPPLTELDWQTEFKNYKQFPEYQKINRGMSLDEFKQIFYWEYGHRVLGRVIGILFFVPFVAFWAMGRLSRQVTPWLLGALVLGGMQGLMGWYMVKSGLVDMPRVSHYRLAAHLSLAMLILAYLFWIILAIRNVPKVSAPATVRWSAWGLLALLTLQIVYGGFVAGLDAGLGFNSYPLMDGKFIADAALMMQPFWHNLVENGAMIQFVHRWLGVGFFIGALAYAAFVYMSGQDSIVRTLAIMLVGVTFLQVMLGILTLINYVPLGLAISHQVFACVVLLTAVANCYVTGR